MDARKLSLSYGPLTKSYSTVLLERIVKRLLDTDHYDSQFNIEDDELTLTQYKKDDNTSEKHYLQLLLNSVNLRHVSLTHALGSDGLKKYLQLHHITQNELENLFTPSTPATTQLRILTNTPTPEALPVGTVGILFNDEIFTAYWLENDKMVNRSCSIKKIKIQVKSLKPNDPDLIHAIATAVDCPPSLVSLYAAQNYTKTFDINPFLRGEPESIKKLNTFNKDNLIKGHLLTTLIFNDYIGRITSPNAAKETDVYRIELHDKSSGTRLNEQITNLKKSTHSFTDREAGFISTSDLSLPKTIAGKKFTSLKEKNPVFVYRFQADQRRSIAAISAVPHENEITLPPTSARINQVVGEAGNVTLIDASIIETLETTEKNIYMQQLALRYVFSERLNKPFEDKSSNEREITLTDSTGKEHVIYKPNHGLAHTARQMQNTEDMIELLSTKAKDKQMRIFCRNLLKDPELLGIVLTTSAFLSCGRENEKDSQDDPIGYEASRQKARSYFEKFINQYYPCLLKWDHNTTPAEKLLFSKIGYLVPICAETLTNFGDLTTLGKAYQKNKTDPETLANLMIPQVVLAGHLLDVHRFISKNNLDKTFLNSRLFHPEGGLFNDTPENQQIISNYWSSSYNLLSLTGNRQYLGDPYTEKFILCSTSPRHIETILYLNEVNYFHTKSRQKKLSKEEMNERNKIRNKMACEYLTFALNNTTSSDEQLNIVSNEDNLDMAQLLLWAGNHLDDLNIVNDEPHKKIYQRYQSDHFQNMISRVRKYHECIPLTMEDVITPPIQNELKKANITLNQEISNALFDHKYNSLNKILDLLRNVNKYSLLTKENCCFFIKNYKLLDSLKDKDPEFLVSNTIEKTSQMTIFGWEVLGDEKAMTYLGLLIREYGLTPYLTYLREHHAVKWLEAIYKSYTTHPQIENDQLADKKLYFAFQIGLLHYNFHYKIYSSLDKSLTWLKRSFPNPVTNNNWISESKEHDLIKQIKCLRLLLDNAFEYAGGSQYTTLREQIITYFDAAEQTEPSDMALAVLAYQYLAVFFIDTAPEWVKRAHDRLAEISKKENGKPLYQFAVMYHLEYPDALEGITYSSRYALLIDSLEKSALDGCDNATQLLEFIYHDLHKKYSPKLDTHTSRSLGELAAKIGSLYSQKSKISNAIKWLRIAFRDEGDNIDFHSWRFQDSLKTATSCIDSLINNLQNAKDLIGLENFYHAIFLNFSAISYDIANTALNNLSALQQHDQGKSLHDFGLRYLQEHPDIHQKDYTFETQLLFTVMKKAALQGHDNALLWLVKCYIKTPFKTPNLACDISRVYLERKQIEEATHWLKLARINPSEKVGSARAENICQFLECITLAWSQVTDKDTKKYLLQNLNNCLNAAKHSKTFSGRSADALVYQEIVIQSLTYDMECAKKAFYSLIDMFHFHVDKQDMLYNFALRFNEKFPFARMTNHHSDLYNFLITSLERAALSYHKKALEKLELFYLFCQESSSDQKKLIRIDLGNRIGRIHLARHNIDQAIAWLQDNDEGIKELLTAISKRIAWFQERILEYRKQSVSEKKILIYTQLGRSLSLIDTTIMNANESVKNKVIAAIKLPTVINNARKQIKEYHQLSNHMSTMNTLFNQNSKADIFLTLTDDDQAMLSIANALQKKYSAKKSQWTIGISCLSS